MVTVESLVWVWNRPRKGTFNGPTTLDASFESSMIHSKFFRPLAHHHLFAVVLNKVGVAAVTKLIHERRPSYISRLIVAVVVNAIKRHPVRSPTNIREEGRKIISPFFAHRNTSTAVIPKSLVFGIKAPGFYSAPHRILYGFWRGFMPRFSMKFMFRHGRLYNTIPLYALLFLLYAAPVFADCVELPIVNVGKLRHPEYEPQIPAGLPNNNYGTDGIPTLNGVPRYPTVIVCYPATVRIPARLGPMTADQAATILHNRNPRIWPFNPDALTIPTRPQRQGSLQRFLGALWDYIGPAKALAGTETDPFTAADSSDLGANWDAFDDGTGLVPCRISGNAAAGTTADVRCYEAYNHYLPSANQTVDVTFQIANGGVFSGGAREFGALIRMTNPASSFSGYTCQARIPGSASTARIRRIDAGSLSTLMNDDGSITWADGDILTCSVTGSTITLKRNGATVISWSDTTYATGRGGIQILDDPADNYTHIDSFTITDTAASVTVRHKPLVIQ